MFKGQMQSGERRGRRALLAGALSLGLAATMAVGPASSAGAAPAKALTVLVSSEFEWSAGLDPATNPLSAATAIYNDAIYGDLFLQQTNGDIVPDLASGYTEEQGGKVWVIHIRPGVKFTDGSPFTSQAVKYNIQRDLLPKNACICAGNFPIKSMATPNAQTLTITLTHAFAPFMAGFIDESPNWIVSPTSLKKMGDAAFKIKPVGAGPFTVSSDTVNSKLVLTANPNFWHKGEPTINTLTFTSVGTDQSAYEALLGHQGQAYVSLSSLNLLKTVEQKFTATPGATNQPAIVQLNTMTAPFNNILARRAIYWATNPDPIMQNEFGTTKYGTQSLEGPGGRFYEKTVPGYPTYNLAKAKAAVKQLGGLKITLLVANSTASENLGALLKAQWAQAGITTNIDPLAITETVQKYSSNDWQLALAQSGGFDPALIPGLAFRFSSKAPFTGVKDPKLDALLTKGAALQSMAARTKVYHEIWEYVAKQALAPVLYSAPAAYDVSVPGLKVFGLTTTNIPVFNWGEVTLPPSS